MSLNDNKYMKKGVEEARRIQQERKNTYRELALKLFPRICARCGREFSGRRLRELTVHHKDHNHENNPLDGSNWELLCIYCHENEHARDQVADAYDNKLSEEPSDSDFTHTPFAGLADMLKNKQQK
jgi:5-methylcytosine-specific restriction endonuclease McrA